MDANYSINNNIISENLLFLKYHLIKCNILLRLEKLNSKELYLIQLTRDLVVNQPHKFTLKNILTTAYLIGSIFMFFHAL